MAFSQRSHGNTTVSLERRHSVFVLSKFKVYATGHNNCTFITTTGSSIALPRGYHGDTYLQSHGAQLGVLSFYFLIGQ